jgi:hypothetical protein
LGPIITFVSVDKINVLCITRDERLVVLLDGQNQCPLHHS